MRVEKLREKEEKYTLELVNKIGLWDREFIIYQWYETGLNDDTFESKFKIIIDMLNISLKVVRVEKERINHSVTEKKVYYLDGHDINLYDLLGKPFIAKRRSVRQNIFLDHFLLSNMQCEYLLEIEDQGLDMNIDLKNTEYTILKNVTKDEAYLNKNMTISFTEKHLTELDFLLKCY